jgi:hypothetical protein
MPETVEVDRVLAAIERYLSSDSSDGLPVVPPTAPAVSAMVEATGLPQETPLGKLPPRLATITVREVAINAVMAGCRPDYAPVLVAAVRAMIDDRFDLFGVACSTKGAAPLVIVNGPIRAALGINCGGNVFGPGFRANATIGRAIRLILLNVGAARPNVLDRGTLGHPGRFTYCIGEDEEDSPWTPLHVERGLQPQQSAVTLFGGEGPRLVNAHQESPEAVLYAVARTLASVGIYNTANITGYSPHVLVFAKEHRDLLHKHGWTKDRIRQYMAEEAVIPRDELERMDGRSDGPVHVVKKADDLLIVAAGGAAGRFACVIPGWSHQSQPVTVAIS